MGIIPARANSSRFPNKVIAEILDKPMIRYVWEAGTQAKLLSDLAVATDCERVAAVVRGFGGRAVMTPTTFTSGTDRVAFVARDSSAEIVLNLQADEPLLPPEAIDALVRALSDDDRYGMATLVVRQNDPADLASPHVVKAVLSRENEALYFSRAPLKSSPEGEFFKHIGIYAYRRAALLKFCEWPTSPLEATERLEQLRALENGIRIKAVEVKWDTVAVDVPDDIARVERRLSNLGVK